MPKLQSGADTARVERVVELITLLTSPRSAYTIDELSKKFCVDRRTMHRDIELLESLGFVVEKCGRQGHYRPFRFTTTSPLTVPFGFTEEELLALYISKTLFRSLDGTHLADAARNAVSKIESYFPDDKIDMLSEAIQVIVGPTRNYREHRAIIKLLFGAIAEKLCVRIGYDSRSSGKFDTFVVHPYRIIFYSNGLFLSAFSEKHRELRTFAIERIHSPEALKSSFIRQEKLTGERIEPFGIYGGKSRTVTIWVKPEEKKRMKQKFIHESQKFKFDRDGSMAVSLEVSGKEDFFRWLLTQKEGVKLLDPVDWLKEYRDILHRMVAVYNK